ncbi:MAG: glycoside hydrolase family 3 N-terminal domain-containing protein [Thermoproteota archaeon]
MTTIDKILQKLSFEKIAGQTIIGYLDEAKSLEELEKTVIENSLSGLVIGKSFLTSFKNPGDSLSKLADKYKRAFGFSLILAAEHEGGNCNVVPSPSTELPSFMGIGATGDSKSAYLAGYLTALELRTLGINANLAPVANLYPYSAGPEENSFGDDPDEVSEYVSSYVRGLRNGGILSFVKYFPRRFFEQRDETLESLSKLHKRDFKPFQTAFKTGVEGVMIGHAPLPAVDDSNTPSFLSYRVIEKIVKRGMGFRNMVIADISNEDNGLEPDRAVAMALKAGNHAVVPTRRIGDLQDILSSIVDRAEKDKDLRNRIVDGATEVLSFKLRKLEKFKRAPEKTRGSRVNKERAWKIFVKSIAIISGVEELPLRWIGRPMLAFTNRLRKLLEDSDGRKIGEVSREELGEVQLLEDVEELSGKRLVEIYRSCSSNTLLVMLIYNAYEDKKGVLTLKKLTEFFRESVVVSFGSPRDLSLFSDAKICVAAFTPSLIALKAVFRILRGRLKPYGKLPVKILK